MSLDIYLGPSVPLGVTRQLAPYSSNLAPSYVPTHLFNPKLHPDIDLKLPVEQILIRKKDSILFLAEDLKNHMEGRIRLFLQQMALLYNTNVKISRYDGADFQVGAVPHKEGPLYVGAHSGTFATLRIDNGASDSSISLGVGTSFYYAWNTTVYLPEEVNKQDLLIDTTLRKDAFAILTEVTKGALNPLQGLRRFLTALTKEIQEDTEILNPYRTVAETYLDNCDNGYPLLQKLFSRPTETPVDDLLFLDVQQEMLGYFSKELPRPKAVQKPDIPQGTKPSLAPKTRLTKTQQEYLQQLLLSDAVTSAALRIFLGEKDVPIEQEILDVLPKKPQGMRVLKDHLIFSVARKALPVPCPSKEQVIALKKDLKARLSSKSLSPTQEKYVSQALQDVAIVKLAKQCFEEMAVYNELAKFRFVTPSKKGITGLSPTALTFYDAVTKLTTYKTYPIILAILNKQG